MSVPTLVMPQAMRPLWPMMWKGKPGKVAPSMESPGASIRARYQRIGAWKARWGSLARIGFPVVLCSPETTQPLEAPVGGPGGGGGEGGGRRRRIGRPEGVKLLRRDLLQQARAQQFRPPVAAETRRHELEP